jgi:hypothetical protein
MLQHVPATFPRLGGQQPEELDEDAVTGSDGSYEPPGRSTGDNGLYNLTFIDVNIVQIYVPPLTEMALPQEEPKAQSIKEWAMDVPKVG